MCVCRRPQKSVLIGHIVGKTNAVVHAIGGALGTETGDCATHGGADHVRVQEEPERVSAGGEEAETLCEILVAHEVEGHVKQRERCALSRRRFVQRRRVCAPPEHGFGRRRELRRWANAIVAQVQGCEAREVGQGAQNVNAAVEVDAIDCEVERSERLQAREVLHDWNHRRIVEIGVGQIQRPQTRKGHDRFRHDPHPGTPEPAPADVQLGQLLALLCVLEDFRQGCSAVAVAVHFERC
eukprot:3090201-Rhodomonas_salina.1